MKLNSKCASALTILILGLSFSSTSVAAKKRFSSTYPQKGLGVATSTAVTRTNTAVTGLLRFNKKSAVQGYLAIGSTSPFAFGLGGIYKHTLVGNNYSGFHIGGGLSLGTTAASAASVAQGNTTDFFIHFIGNMGVHFSIPSLPNIFVSVDAGPALTLVRSTADFGIGGFADVLGMSIIYVF